MKIGYARVSTKEQLLDLQMDALKKAGCKAENIYQEKISGAKSERPKLNDVIKKLRPGDELIVWKLDRLGRSIRDLIKIVTTVQEMGAGFQSLQDSINTATPAGKLTFHLFAALAEFERDIIRQRTKAGLEAARARGRKGGRPKGLSQKAKHTAMIAERLYKEGELSTQEICDQLSISKMTLYSYLRYQGVEVGTHRKKIKFLKAELWLTIENNSSHVRGKKKAKETIELFVLRKFDYKKDKKRDWIYTITIPYQTKEELEEKIDLILMEIHHHADLYNTFVQDCSIQDLENEDRYWG
jgi:DNA invertase Pin-like site-specific DNA recombinase